MYSMKTIVLVSGLLASAAAVATTPAPAAAPTPEAAATATASDASKRNWLTFWRADEAEKAAKAQAKAEAAEKKLSEKKAATKAVIQPRNHSYSGYLVNYSDMQDVKTPSGDHALRWVSPELKKGQYHSIMIDPVGFYPLPPHDARVSKGTMLLVARYLADQAKAVVGKDLKVVTQPGPGVLRWDAAITGVSSEGSNIDNLTVAHIWEEKVPGGPVVPRKVEVYLESKLIDSQTKKVVAKSVRRGLGSPAPQAGKRLTVEEMKPVLNAWVQDASIFVKTSVK